jgi:hypothetical protein
MSLVSIVQKNETVRRKKNPGEIKYVRKLFFFSSIFFLPPLGARGVAPIKPPGLGFVSSRFWAFIDEGSSKTPQFGFGPLLFFAPDLPRLWFGRSLARCVYPG